MEQIIAFQHEVINNLKKQLTEVQNELSKMKQAEWERNNTYSMTICPNGRAVTLEDYKKINDIQLPELPKKKKYARI